MLLKKVISTFASIVLLLSYAVPTFATDTQEYSESCRRLVNVGQFKPVVTSANNILPAENAVDGLVDSDKWAPSKKLDGEENIWFMIDLTREYRIDHIEIYDGNEAWARHRSYLEVQASGTSDFSAYTVLDSIGSEEDTEKYPQGGCWIVPGSDTPYRYVRIKRTDTQEWCPYLREVKVFAYQTMTEISSGKTVEASSYHINSETGYEYLPKYINDGDASTYWVSYKNNKEWLCMDLEQPHSVDYVEILSRSADLGNTARHTFEFIGSNSSAEADAEFAEGTRLGYTAAQKFIPADELWGAGLYSPEAYRYFIFHQTYEGQNAGMNEIHAYMVSPDVYDVAATNTGVDIRFSDIMDETTLSSDTIKLFDAMTGAEVSYTDYSYSGLTYSINADLDQDAAYRVCITTGVKNHKNTPLAEEYSDVIVNGSLPSYGEDTYEKAVITNVAQFKNVTTSSSSTANLQYINDGVVDSYSFAPGAKAEGETNHWISIDLTRKYKIDHIEIFDANDAWSVNRKNLEVQASETADFADYDVLDSIGSEEDTEKYPQGGCWNIPGNDTPYRYVRIKRTDTQNYSPKIREIKVFACETVTEVSRNKPTKSCSQWSELFTPDKANDGINLTSTTTAWIKGDSSADHYCWWQVDLGARYYIDYIEIEDRVNNDDITLRQMFNIKGTNSASCEDETFPDSYILASMGNPSTTIAPEYHPFAKGAVWSASAYPSDSCRYVIYQKIYLKQSAGIAEIRLCVVNPDVYDFVVSGDDIALSFSDEMLEGTMNPDTIKIYDCMGSEVKYDEFIVSSDKYQIKNAGLIDGEKYTLYLSDAVRNKKLVPVGKSAQKTEFYAGNSVNIFDFENTSSIDGRGLKAEYLEENVPYGARAKVLNNGESEVCGALITALYKDGKLVRANIDRKSVPAGGISSFAAGFDIWESDLYKYTAKTFLWDMGAIKPLTENKMTSVQSVFNTEIFDTVPVTETAEGFDAAGVNAIYYEGLPYEGNETKVFAYYGIPDVSDGEKVPGVVLVHGGGGTAYASWVRSWNERGYAAIAMDLGGKNPDMNRHQWAGPKQCTYNDLYKPIEDVWMYHAVADVMLANNILRSFPEVDSSKIGISGVSWGGVVTSTAIGVDSRFAFAVPIYGCGYLYESETYFKDTLADKSKFIDPSQYFKRSEMPVLFVNDDTDYHFSTTITTKSYDTIKDNAAITFLPQTAHAQETAEAMKEPYEFADSIVKNGIPLIKITEAYVVDENAIVSYSLPEGREAAEVYLSYNTDESFTYSSAKCTSTWSIVNDDVTQDTITIQIPDCKRFYVSIKDTSGNIVSTRQFTKNNGIFE